MACQRSCCRLPRKPLALRLLGYADQHSYVCSYVLRMSRCTKSCTADLLRCVLLGAPCCRQWLAASTEDKIELCCLLSFALALLGCFTPGFPVESVFAVSLLGLISCRSHSEMRLLAFVLFSAISAVTDVVALCVRNDGWGSLMLAIDLIPKLLAASYTFRLSSHLGGEPDEFEPAGMAASASAGTLGSESYTPVTCAPRAQHLRALLREFRMRRATCFSGPCSLVSLFPQVASAVARPLRRIIPCAEDSSGLSFAGHDAPARNSRTDSHCDRVTSSHLHGAYVCLKATHFLRGVWLRASIHACFEAVRCATPDFTNAGLRLHARDTARVRACRRWTTRRSRTRRPSATPWRASRSSRRATGPYDRIAVHMIASRRPCAVSEPLSSRPARACAAAGGDACCCCSGDDRRAGGGGGDDGGGCHFCCCSCGGGGGGGGGRRRCIPPLLTLMHAKRMCSIRLRVVLKSADAERRHLKRQGGCISPSIMNQEECVLM
eukprot:1936978-Pleurochrysis_carterae.AAC.4